MNPGTLGVFFFLFYLFIAVGFHCGVFLLDENMTVNCDTESVSSVVSPPQRQSCWQRVFWGRGAAGTLRWWWGGWGLSTTRLCTVSWKAAESSRRSSACDRSCSSGTCGRRGSPLCESHPAKAEHTIQMKVGSITNSIIITNTNVIVVTTTLITTSLLLFRDPRRHCYHYNKWSLV